MRHASIASLFVASCFVLMTTQNTRADEPVLASKIDSVGLFKNGLAVVDRTVQIPGGGTFKIEDVPTPIHGTFFIESASPVVARTTMQLVEAPLDLAGNAMQDQLAGKAVSITLREQPAPVTGVVASIEPANKSGVWSRDYEQPRYGYDPYGRWVQMNQPASRFLVVDTRDGQVLVDQSAITAVNVTGGAKTAKVRKPVLMLTVTDGSPAQTIRVRYLTQGLAWAPSYRVDLLDDKKLAITQNAVVKNELSELKDVEMSLISGFPSVDFGHVVSPLALSQNWATFFAQLSQPTNERRGGRQVVMQQAVMSNRAGDDTAGPALPSDDSVDVHYEAIGKKSLAEGDAMSLNVATGEADYERIVEWIVPDSRDAYGRYIQDYQRQQDPEKYEDAAWDAVKFKNPLPFAMTTAPATFAREGKFLGQQTSKWVNKEEENTLRITKALSIRTRASEQEEPNNDRQIVYIGGNDFRKVGVRGELTIKNYRKVDTKIVIKRQFSGDLTSADENPTNTLREEGVWSVNRRNELSWTLTLKAGEEKTLKYAYMVLVDN